MLDKENLLGKTIAQSTGFWGFYVGTSSWEEGLGIDQCCTFRGSMARLDILAGNIIWQIIMLQATIFKEELTQDLLFGQQSRD
ncbi:hypothetical protein AAC387_Pa07g2356 [Persea americana]